MGNRREAKKIKRRNAQAAKHLEGHPAPREKQRIRAVARDNDNSALVRWSFQCVDTRPLLKSVHWSLSPEETAQVLGHLEHIQEKTWNECYQERAHGHKKNHSQPVKSLAKAAQVRLGELEVLHEELFRFRFNSTWRLWGYREGQKFYVLWFDRDHEVYPVGKKHT